MTKKRSLLLTGLFAVSGILPFHAARAINDFSRLFDFTRWRFDTYALSGSNKPSKKTDHQASNKSSAKKGGTKARS
jgi:hypothetical protein